MTAGLQLALVVIADSLCRLLERVATRRAQAIERRLQFGRRDLQFAHAVGVHVVKASSELEQGSVATLTHIVKNGAHARGYRVVSLC